VAKEGELPGADLVPPPPEAELAMPPTLDLPGPSGTLANLDLPEIKLDAPLDMPPPAPEPAAAPKAAPPAGKPSGGKKPAGKPPKARTGAAAPGRRGLPRVLRDAQFPVLLIMVNILLLLAIMGIMPLFGIAANVVPDLTLDAYVEGLWLAVGCFVVVALLNDVRTALVFTGIDLVMLVTIFPTLWLLLGTPMSPMYFYVLGLIAMLAFVALPQKVLKSRRAAIKKAAPA